MMPWKPKLGEVVLFDQHLEKWTGEEYEAAQEADLPRIEAKIVPNPDPDQPAMAVGVVSKSVEGIWTHTSADPEDESGYFDWGRGRRRTFYVLKRSIRGRRFLVPIEAMRPVNLVPIVPIGN